MKRFKESPLIACFQCVDFSTDFGLGKICSAQARALANQALA